MNYCALDDAFQAPGCTNDYASKAARKEERRKARRCKGLQETYFERDPDRQPNKVPQVPAMNTLTGLQEHTSSQYEGFRTDTRKDARTDGDPVGDRVRDELPEIPKISSRATFFGADPDGFADYTPNAPNYQLQPDFSKAFEREPKALPRPSTNIYWKPTISGAETSFTNSRSHDISNDDIMKKLDKLWARLDDMNRTSPEQVTSELLMFISSGIFVIFMMDILVKKGSKLRF